jgi:hypothetical protein
MRKVREDEIEKLTTALALRYPFALKKGIEMIVLFFLYEYDLFYIVLFHFTGT